MNKFQFFIVTKTFIVLMAFTTFFTSCEESYRDETVVEALDKNMDIQARSNSQDYYNLLYKDENYKNLVLGFTTKNYDLSQMAESSVRAALNDENIQEVVSVWKENLPSETKEFKLAFGEFIRATNDLQKSALGLDDGTTSGGPCLDGSRRYFGAFEYPTRELDCDAIEQEIIDEGLNGVCCARLYCEEANCQARAYLEAVQEIPTDLTDAAFSLFVGIVWQQGGFNFSRLSKLAAAEILVATIFAELGAILFDAYEMLFKSWWCTIPRVNKFNNWGEECNCHCPRHPICGEYYNPIFGGFNIPDNCE